MKKIFVSIITLIIMAISVCQVSYAAEEAVSFDWVSTINLEEGKVTVVLSIGKYENLPTDQIVAYQANLEYNKDVFSSVKVEGLNNWRAQYEETTGTIVGETESGAKVAPNQQIAKFTFTLKDGVEEVDTEIKLKIAKFTVNAEKNFNDFGTLTAKVKINKKNEDGSQQNEEQKKDESDNQNEEQNKDENDDQNVEPKENVGQGKEESKNDNNPTGNTSKLVTQAKTNATTTPKVLPKTGAYKIATVVVLIAIVGIACLIRYKSIQIK